MALRQLIGMEKTVLCGPYRCLMVPARIGGNYLNKWRESEVYPIPDNIPQRLLDLDMIKICDKLKVFLVDENLRRFHQLFEKQKYYKTIKQSIMFKVMAGLIVINWWKKRDFYGRKSLQLYAEYATFMLEPERRRRRRQRRPSISSISSSSPTRVQPPRQVKVSRQRSPETALEDLIRHISKMEPRFQKFVQNMLDPELRNSLAQDDLHLSRRVAVDSADMSGLNIRNHFNRDGDAQLNGAEMRRTSMDAITFGDVKVEDIPGVLPSDMPRVLLPDLPRVSLPDLPMVSLPDLPWAFLPDVSIVPPPGILPDTDICWDRDYKNSVVSKFVSASLLESDRHMENMSSIPWIEKLASFAELGKPPGLRLRNKRTLKIIREKSEKRMERIFVRHGHYLFECSSNPAFNYVFYLPAHQFPDPEQNVMEGMMDENAFREEMEAAINLGKNMEFDIEENWLFASALPDALKDRSLSKRGAKKKKLKDLQDEEERRRRRSTIIARLSLRYEGRPSLQMLYLPDPLPLDTPLSEEQLDDGDFRDLLIGINERLEDLGEIFEDIPLEELHIPQGKHTLDEIRTAHQCVKYLRQRDKVRKRMRKLLKKLQECGNNVCWERNHLDSNSEFYKNVFGVKVNGSARKISRENPTELMTETEVHENWEAIGRKITE